MFEKVGLVGAAQIADQQLRGGAGVPGGLSPEEPITDEVRKMVTDLDQQIKAHQSSIEKLEPVSFRTQVVAGTNYFIKVSFLISLT